MTRAKRGARVAVIGAGAIGGMLAAGLAEAGHEVCLCLRTPVDRLSVEIGGVTRDVPARFVTDPSQAQPVDWVFVTTKVQDSGGTAPWFRTLCGPGTIVVAAQNGVDNEERLRAVAPDATILPAVVYCSAERVAPGRIRHHTSSRLVVGESEAGRALVALMKGSLFTVDLAPDIRTAAWRKLLANVAANPITALTLRRQSVFAEPDVQALGRSLLAEAVAAGRAAGADLSEADADQVAAALAGPRGQGGSSMLYDRLAVRPLEHEFITGAVVAAAEQHGIDVPLNRAILALLRAASGRRLDGSE